jgi:hypothetical protein
MPARARGTVAPARLPGTACLLCKEALDRLVLYAEKDTALLSAGERRRAQSKYKRPRATQKWNLQKLKCSLSVNAFDLDGGWIVHSSCLCATFGVSPWYCTSLHRRTVEERQLPLVKGQKEDVIISEDLLSRVVVPSE